MKQLIEARVCMPVWQWPSRDRTAWKKACLPADPFDPSIGRAAIWKETTRRDYERGYGRWLSFLDGCGELDRDATPGERATEERLRAFLAHLRQIIAPYTQANYLMGLSRVLNALEPDGDFAWISTASRRIHSKARPVRDTSEELVDVEKILQLGIDMMWEAEHGRFRSIHQNATLFRNGLMLAVMVHRALRIANFGSITVGERLHRRGERWWLSFPAEEMKNGKPFECPFPDDLVTALDRYLEVHRPVLLDGRDKATEGLGPLWISRGSNGMMSTGDIRVRIETITKQEFGIAIPPHAMRRKLATAMSTHDPEDAAAASTMLSHEDPETTAEYYNKAKQADAALRLQATLKTVTASVGRREKRTSPPLKTAPKVTGQARFEF